MPIRVRLSSLGETRWYEYAVRLLLGGITTMLAGLIAKLFGPVAGGLFLAFPAIFPASATLVEKHERRRKEKVGLRGTQRGKDAAALDAAGAAVGSFGLAAFGAVIWLVIPTSVTIAFLAAAAAWALIIATVWWLWRVLRLRC
jgi:hypothetical protein